MGKPNNEAIFESYLNSKCSTILKSKLSWKNENVSISTDFHVETEKYIYLIEVDASNQAKLIVGQYLLINILKNYPSKKTKLLLPKKKKAYRFIVIHFFKKYNKQRSTVNMRLINEEILGKKGIPAGSIHFNDFVNETSDFSTASEFGSYFELLTKTKLPNLSK